MATKNAIQAEPQYSLAEILAVWAAATFQWASLVGLLVRRWNPVSTWLRT